MQYSSFPLGTALVTAVFSTREKCDSADTACSASQFLHWLYLVAGILALVLILVIVLAVRVWRKNKNADLER